MKRIFSALTMVVMISGTPVAAADCLHPNLAGPMQQLEAYYQQQVGRLFRAQLVLDAWRKDMVIKADGKWGPQTAGVICDALDTHVAIGGWGWELPSTPAVISFDNWIAAAAHATVNGGEFPD